MSLKEEEEILFDLQLSKHGFLFEIKGRSDEEKYKLYCDLLSHIRSKSSKCNLEALKKSFRYVESVNESAILNIILNTCDSNFEKALKRTNIVILACKYNAIKILKWIFNNDKILKTFSAFIGKDMIQPSDEDNESHNAFYYAIRSNNTELLDVLINMWPGDAFDSDHNDVDFLLASSYEILKIINVPLSNKMEYYVGEQIISLRFLSSNSSSMDTSIDDILERIDVVLEGFEILKNKHSANPYINEKFLYIVKFIARNIHILKRQLKISYSSLPWEEIEFCLVIFISSYTKKQENNIYSRSILNKDRIFQHLENFMLRLNEEKDKIKLADINEICKLPGQSRSTVVSEIMKDSPMFEDLYKDFKLLRDIHSLLKINDCLNIATKTDCTKQEGKIIVIRALQITGEHLKNTLESPNLSTITSNLLVSLVPENTRKILINLRNSFSHAYSIDKRNNIDDNSDDYYKNILKDLNLLNEVIFDILRKEKLNLVIKILKKLVSSESSVEVNEIIEIFSTINIETLLVLNFTNEVELVQQFIDELNRHMSEKTEYEKYLLQKMTNVINEDEDINLFHSRSGGFAFTLMQCRAFSETAYLFDFNDSNVRRDAKFYANCVLKHISDVKINWKTEVLDILSKLLTCLKNRLEENNIEGIQILMSWHRLFINLQNDVSELQGIQNMFNQLFSKTKNLCKSQNMQSPNCQDLLQNKLSLLKVFLKDKNLLFENISDKDISCYKRENEWQLVIEMLLLDILSALETSKTKLSNNLTFLDDYTPLLNGRGLRNHLSHFNSIMEIEHFDSTLAILLNAQKFVNQEWNKENLILGKTSVDIPSLVRRKFFRGLDYIIIKNNMLEACEKGNFEEFIALSENGSDINSRRDGCISSLHCASKGSDLSTVQHIFKNIQNSDFKDINGDTPLHVAAANDCSKVVKYFLINKIFDANETNNNLETALHKAVFGGCTEAAEILLKYNKDIYVKNIFGYSAIHIASLKNQIEIVKCLHRNGININSETMGKFTPLHIAAENGFVDLVKVLLEKGANINAINDKGGIPLHTTALNGHIEVIKILLSKGSNINSRVNDGSTALQYAVENSHEEVVKVLLSNGANPNLPQIISNYAPLHCAAEYGKINIAALLLENGAHVNISTSEGFSSLHLAAANGHLQVVKLLLRYRANITSQTSNKISPLQLGVKKNHTEVVKYLVKKGATVNCEDIFCVSLLHIGVQNGNVELVNFMIENGANINAKTITGVTPLHMSLQYGFENIFEILLKNNADIHCKNNIGWNCLHFATNFHGNFDIIGKLSSLGFDLNGKNNKNQTALHLASHSGNYQVVKELLHHNVIIDLNDLLGLTPLHFAVLSNSKDITEILINCGSNVNMKNQNCFTPLHFAIQNKNPVIVKYLLDNGADVNLDNGKALQAAVLSRSLNIVNHVLDSCDAINIEFLNNALGAAVAKGYNNIVKALILKGADVNHLLSDAKAKNSFVSPLHISSLSGFSEVTKTLITFGADVNTETYGGDIETPLHVAAKFGHTKVVQTLMESEEINVLIKDYKNRTAIELAVADCHLEVVQLLLSHENINSKGNDGWTLLHISAQSGNSKMTKFLLNNGADLHSRNNFGSKPFHVAAREGHLQDLVLFIEKGNSVEDIGSAGWNLAHYAAVGGHLGVLKFLINKNIDVNAIDLQGRRPLNYSVERGFREFSEFLIENGAYYNVFKPIEIKSFTIINKQIMHLLEATENLYNAVKLNDSKNVEKYIKEGAFVNGKKKENNTPLHYSSWKGFHDIVNILLKNNANPNIIGKGGCTPLHYAAKFNHYEIVLALLSRSAAYNMANKNGKTPLDFASNENIIGFLKLIANIFEMVQNCDMRVFSKLEKAENEMKNAIIKCQNKEHKSFLTVAILNDFPNLNVLKTMLCKTDYHEILAAESLSTDEKYNEALTIYKKILNRRQNIWGTDNPLTLEIETNVATMYYKSGNYQEALSTFENIYQTQTKILGLSNKLTLKTRNLFALVLHRLGRDEEALKIFQEVYFKQLELFGENDSDVLNTRFHMALSLDSLGKHDEALIHNSEVYERSKKILGIEHPTTFSAYNNCASILINKGDFKEALNIYMKVYEIKSKILGPNHSNTLRTLQHIGAILPFIRNDSEGVKLSEHVYKLNVNVLGPDHPETLYAKHIIARCHFMNGNISMAYRINYQLLPESKRIFGVNHPFVKGIENTLNIINEQSRFLGFDTSNFLNDVEGIHSAANIGNIPKLEDLIKSGYDVNEKDSENRTALHFAVNNGHISAIKTLLSHMADPMIVTSKGNTALHTAVLKNLKEIAEMLLSYTKEKIPNKLQNFVNAKTYSSGTTALHIAAKIGSENIVKVLLDFGAVYNVIDSSMKTPLQYSSNMIVSNLLSLTEEAFESAKSGNHSILSKLKKEKLDTISAVLNARNEERQTVIQVALTKDKNLGRGFIKLIIS